MSRPVLLVRPDSNGPDAAALAAVNLKAVIDPYLCVRPPTATGPAWQLLQALESIDADRACWLVVTSARALPAWAEIVGRERLMGSLHAARASGLLVAAVGSSTAATIPGDRPADLVATPPHAERLVAELLVAGSVDSTWGPRRPVSCDGRTGARPTASSNSHRPMALLPQSEIARRTVDEGLRAAGWQVLKAPVYTTVTAPDRPDSAALIQSGVVAAVVLRSPSAVAAVHVHAVPHHSVAMVTVGPTTTRSARDMPWRLLSVDDTTPSAVAAALAAHLSGEAHS